MPTDPIQVASFQLQYNFPLFITFEIDSLFRKEKFQIILINLKHGGKLEL